MKTTINGCECNLFPVKEEFCLKTGKCYWSITIDAIDPYWPVFLPDKKRDTLLDFNLN